jgi:hypothetical protein
MNRVALLVSVAALAVAVLGATPLGEAAQQLVLPANSVGPKQLRAGAVSSAKVLDGSLLARDFRRGQLPRGAQGPVGPAGPAGPAGAAGIVGLQFVGGESGFDSSSPKTATATCPAGKRAISWSWRVELVTTANEAGSPALTELTPIDFDPAAGRLPTGYTAKAEEAGFYPDAWKLFAYVTCATA